MLMAQSTPPVIAINAHNVHKVYDTGKINVHALRGLDLQVEKGEMVAIMGPSGCGKTTLLNCLSGLDDITDGEVLIEGQAIHKFPDSKRTEFRARRMGFVFQFFNLLPVLSAVEIVELPLLVSGYSVSQARKLGLEALDIVGLVAEAHRRPAELSGGQQQRVAVARSLVNKPAIVWADEPTGNLDSETSGTIMDLLCRLNKESHLTFVIVTHALEVGNRAHRIVRMRDGRIEREERNEVTSAMSAARS
ncbi:MAG: ABC transporter ATP-binding protein [Chloroflexi bacterium]|nr:ABC transporter ATP-binding protein [Chloroflexota bacterium]